MNSEERRYFSGMTYMLMASVTLAAMSIFSKMVFRATKITPLQVSVTRSTVMGIGSLYFAQTEGVDVLLIPRKHFSNLIWRCILGTIGSVC